MKLGLILPSWQKRLKRFLPLLFVASFLSVLWLDNFTPVAAQISPPQQIRGVWMTANDKDMLKNKAKLREAVSQLRKLNFNTIYPVVWNSGYAMYPSAVAQRRGIQSFIYKGDDGHDTLADVIAQGHREGLLVIPWFEFGFMTPETSELALNHPQWLTQTRDGTKTWQGAAGEVVWLNPFHPQVQEFITELVLEIVTKYNADGIQFDDHMSLPSTFGYDRYTTALYTQETSSPPPANPQDGAWIKWRADKITQFIAQLNQAVKARKPRAIFSVSPNYYDLAYKFHLQDWLNWVRWNLVDEIVMQVYRQDIDQFNAQIDRPEIREVKQKIPTAIGIMTGMRNRPVPIARIKAQASSAQYRGLGVAFFYYESLWEESPEPADKRQSAFLSLFPRGLVRDLPLPVQNPLPPINSDGIPNEITDEVPSTVVRDRPIPVPAPRPAINVNPNTPTVVRDRAIPVPASQPTIDVNSTPSQVIRTIPQPVPVPIPTINTQPNPSQVIRTTVPSVPNPVPTVNLDVITDEIRDEVPQPVEEPSPVFDRDNPDAMPEEIPDEIPY